MKSDQQKETHAFFVNRWQHPMCRWKKRILPIFWCILFSTCVIFFINSVVIPRFLQNIPIDYLEILIQSFACVSLSISFIFIAYYFYFRQKRCFLFIYTYIKRR